MPRKNVNIDKFETESIEYSQPALLSFITQNEFNYAYENKVKHLSFYQFCN
jgi:hypothetical protein